MSASLEGRTALVTGATSGIGRGVAQALAAAGAHVVVHGRDAARGSEVVDGITSAGGAAAFVAADLAGGAAAITPLAARAADLAGGPIDILVNNAAYLVGQIAATGTPGAVIDTALAVSVKAPILLTAALVPAMAERGGGVIINMGSINGITKTALYGSTKSAVHGPGPGPGGRVRPGRHPGERHRPRPHANRHHPGSPGLPGPADRHLRVPGLQHPGPDRRDRRSWPATTPPTSTAPSSP